MGRIYTVISNPTIAATSADLFTLLTADDHPVKLLGFRIEQSTIIKDANEQAYSFFITRGYTTVGSGGAAKTPQAMNPNSPAPSFTCRGGDTTGASGVDASTVNVWAGAFNARSGYEMWFPKGTEPVFVQTGSTNRYAVCGLSKPDATSVVFFSVWLLEEL